MEGKYITVEEILDKVNSETKTFIKQLELDELNDRIESISSIEGRIKLQNQQTEIMKNNFINEIKNGLGVIIKENPTTIEVIKPSVWDKLGKLIKKFFAMF